MTVNEQLRYNSEMSWSGSNESDRAGRRVEIGISDPAALSSLARWLNRTPGVQVERGSTLPSGTELGGMEILVAVLGSSGLTALITALPEFLKSRRGQIELTVRAGGREIHVKTDDPAVASDLVRELRGE